MRELIEIIIDIHLIYSYRRVEMRDGESDAILAITRPTLISRARDLHNDLE